MISYGSSSPEPSSSHDMNKFFANSMCFLLDPSATYPWFFRFEIHFSASFYTMYLFGGLPPNSVGSYSNSFSLSSHIFFIYCCSYIYLFFSSVASSSSDPLSTLSFASSQVSTPRIISLIISRSFLTPYPCLVFFSCWLTRSKFPPGLLEAEGLTALF